MKMAEALALVGGYVVEEALKWNEYLAAEDEILRSKLTSRISNTSAERIRLVKLSNELGRSAFEGVAAIVKPETILAWFRKLVAQKHDSSTNRTKVGRQRTREEIEALVVYLAETNPSRGYSSIIGQMSNLGLKLCEDNIAENLRRHGIPPTPHGFRYQDAIEQSSGIGQRPRIPTRS